MTEAAEDICKFPNDPVVRFAHLLPRSIVEVYTDDLSKLFLVFAFFFTLGIHVVISNQSNRLFKLPEEKEKSPRKLKNLERHLFTPRLTVYKFTVHASK